MAKQNRKRFKLLESQDFTIEDDTGIIGHIRVKPSAVLWKPVGAQQYYRLALDKLAELATQHGKSVDK